MKTKPVFSNCQFGVFYLVIRGKGVRLAVTSGGNRLLPWHMGVVTRKGHYLDFNRVLPHKENIYGAWWFLGAFRGLRKSRWERALQRERGKIRYLPIWVGWVIGIGGYILLFTPWVLTWTLFGPYWSLSWGFHGIRKRVFKHKTKI